MEHREYRIRERLQAWRRNGAAAAAVAAADGVGTPLLGTLDDATDHDPHHLAGLNVEPALSWLPHLAGLDIPVNGLVTGVGLAAAIYAQYGLTHRDSEEFQALQRRRASGWATLRDLWNVSGAAAARRSGKNTRPSFSAWTCWRRPVTEFGAVLGRAVTGSRLARGRRVVNTWERGVLVIGEPGTRKSTLLAGHVIDFPGPLAVISTKSEFLNGTGELRAQRGPVAVFDPISPQSHAGDQYESFRWDIVDGCRDANAAAQRAEAIMAASDSDGNNASFFQGRARAVITALFAAADLGGHTLRDVGTWLQTEDYDRPITVLEHYRDQLEEYLVNALEQMRSSSAGATSGSAAQTGAQVLEFLADSRVADALAPERGTGTDADRFLRQQGTLFMITENRSALAPVMSALFSHLTWTVKTIAANERMDPPFGAICDEAHRTMPGVPLHDHVAELRGWGAWLEVAVQNYAQIEELWGQAAARTMRASLQTTIITGAHDEPDREMFAKRVGTRVETHVTSSVSGPDDTRRRVFGNWFGEGRHRSTGTQRVEVPIMRPEEFSRLAYGEALVLQNKGGSVIVEFPNHWARAADLTEQLHAQSAAEDARAASRREQEQQAPAGAPSAATQGGSQ